MALPPKAPDRLPTMEHEGVTIEIINHHGFSTPNKGPQPKSRMLYGARNPEDGERHWRASYDEIISLINHGFVVASGES